MERLITTRHAWPLSSVQDQKVKDQGHVTYQKQICYNLATQGRINFKLGGNFRREVDNIAVHPNESCLHVSRFFLSIDFRQLNELIVVSCSLNRPRIPATASSIVPLSVNKAQLMPTSTIRRWCAAQRACTLCLKKTSHLYNLLLFLHTQFDCDNFWHKCCRESRQSLFSHLT